ncbi:MAG: hypothetical protein ACI9VR_000769, partial [Cognaticolwellia sp.]
ETHRITADNTQTASGGTGGTLRIAAESCQLGQGEAVPCTSSGSGDTRTLSLVRGGPRTWTLERQDESHMVLDRGDKRFVLERRD